VLPVLLLASVLAGCGSGHSAARAPASERPGPSLQTLLVCLQQAGADAKDVTASQDLRVSRGELGVSFGSFNAYVGVAADHRSAIAAAEALDRQIAVLRQAGHGVVRGSSVFYFDAPLVPRAGARLIEACVAGSDVRATAAMAALSRTLPTMQLPLRLKRRLVARCQDLTGNAGCACVYTRAVRLFSYAQVEGLGRAWQPRRALAVIAGLLGTCPPANPVARV
jgi:hypothetical protein